MPKICQRNETMNRRKKTRLKICDAHDKYDKTCAACQKKSADYDRNRRAKLHPETKELILERNRIYGRHWYNENKEKQMNAVRKWRMENRERRNAQRRKWWSNLSEAEKEYHRARKRASDRRRRSLIRNSRKRREELTGQVIDNEKEEKEIFQTIIKQLIEIERMSIYEPID